MESYKNILANKFMRDTNYIIIKDTDDLEELERQYELFNSQLTMRQQRLSDDRSIEIWNMTNKEHYESLKIELMKKIDSNFGDEDLDKEYDNFFYDPAEDGDDSEITGIFNADLDSFEIPDDDIIESVKEEPIIPIENNDTKISEPKQYYSFLNNNQDIQKDNIADQYEIDTNIRIIGRITGRNVDDYLNNLEKSFISFNSQTHDCKKESDDKCREIYGISNIERYNRLKASALKFKLVKTVEKITSTDNKTLYSSQVQQLGEFVSQVYNNMQIIDEAENLKVNKHRRFNDTPYFTPTELIDMGVHGNYNFYSNEPDNDGLITNVKVATWFDSYKDMCMDHIFEDYRKDWIDTLDMLYSDFEDIKSSGDEEKILARKQSILDLGWNPEIPFNRKNRLKASRRVSKILDETIPRDIFINLDDIAEEDDIVEEQITKQTHKPVLLIFTQGKTPVVSQGIKFFTGSNYSHASISFDPELNEVYSYNMRGENFGFVRENLSSFKDNIISVIAFFAPNHIVESLKNKINDFKDNKTTFDLRIFLNKILHIDHKVSKNEYNQVCSTFVDTVLKSGGINLVGDTEIPDPGQLYNASKSVPNKIIEVFNGIATKYNGKTVKRKLNTLYNKIYISIEEACKDLKSAREFVSKVGELAKKYDANYFIVTDGASGIRNNGNPAVKDARDSQIKWEKEHGFDPDEDWSKKCTLNANRRANPNVIEKLIYKSRDEFYGERKYDRFLSKLGAQNESVSVLNEVKRFPIEFDKEGNLIIYKARIGSLAFGDEIDDSVQLLQAYRNASNIEGIKYELAKLWYINDCIEKKLKKRLSNDEYKELIDTRATCLNVFKTNLDYVMKAEKGFNFSDYYNSTPFSDDSTKITANTLKYVVKTITNMI